MYSRIRRSVAICLPLCAATAAVAQQPGIGAIPPAQVLEGDQAKAFGISRNWLTRVVDDQTGNVIELVRVVDGKPQYYITHNQLSGETINTDQIRPWQPLADGSTITIGLWDEGRARVNHQEMLNRIAGGDGTLNQNADHATHVAGTMIATGVSPAAIGMAPAALIRSYDWSFDTSEMSSAGSWMRCSNHSYGNAGGWTYTAQYGWVWFGGLSETEDSNFGRYDSGASQWDGIAHNNPYYLIVKSAGNDGNDEGPGANQPHVHWDSPTVQRTCFHQVDATPSYRFDTITSAGVAKNVLTVGAVSGINGGWNGPSTPVSLADFSSCGPADDRRIKPDVVANGVNVVSAVGSGTSEYAIMSGTSMASPAVCGSASQLIEYWRELNNNVTGTDLRSATIKGLIIHTARAPGDAPSLLTGWGVMDSLAAAVAMKSQYYARNGDLSQDAGRDLIRELTLENGGQYETTIFNVQVGQRVRVTLCWTDPAHGEIGGLDNTTPALVNDLDLRVHFAPANRDHKPWRVQSAGQSFIVRNDYPDDESNTVDNVEVVEFVAPSAGDYSVHVTHKGTLAAPQPYSLLINGVFRKLRTVPGDNASLPSALLSMLSEPEGGAIVLNAGTYTGMPADSPLDHPITFMAVDGPATIRP